LEQESAKKLKTSEEVPEEVKSSEEVPKEKVKEIMQLVPVKEIYVEALQVKHPIIDWKSFEEVPKEKVKEMMQLVPVKEIYVEALQVKHPIIDWKRGFESVMEISEGIPQHQASCQVRRLEKKRKFKTLGLKRLRKVGTAQRVKSSADTVMDDQEDASKQGGIAELDATEDVTLETVDAEVATNADDIDEAEPVEVEEVIEVVTAAKLMTEVVTAAAATITAAQVPKANQVKRKEKQDNTVMRYQALKRKPVTKAQARKNMMVYLKNMVGFKMDFFRGMTYTDIRPIFEKHYNSIQAFLDKREEEIIEQEEGSKRKDVSPEQRVAKKQRIDEKEEELKRHLQIVVNDDDVFTEATPLALKLPVVDYQIYYENNKPFYKIIRADGTHKLFLSFITILKNFDREELEMLWKLVQERF
nr:hypothetical protein [Tanacetum cinerariifolium]